jgi:hypothetical protein
MRASSLVVAIMLANVMAACSKAEPADDALTRDLDLALSNDGGNAVASQLERGVQPKAKSDAPAAPRHQHMASAARASIQPRATETAAVPEPITVSEELGEETILAADPSPEPIATSTAAAPEPEHQPARSGRGGGTFPIPVDIGVGRGGNGGIIIIRGGGSGDDACDERPGQGTIGGIGGTVMGGVIGTVLGGRNTGNTGAIPRLPSPGPIGRRF